jgi:hypothetical protein
VSQPLDDYLLEVERRAAKADVDRKYLWPRTPRDGDLQGKIRERVGVTDLDVHDSRSRPAMIIKQIRRLQNGGWLSRGPSILDIACGDALVLLALKQAFPDAQCYGLDCAKGCYTTHADVERGGVRLYRGFLQDLFTCSPPAPFDLVLMLNTYRGWESADLHEDESDLPRQADRWLLGQARYAIVTATPRQVVALKGQGVNVARLGKGEENSMMVCFSHSPGWLDIWDRVRVALATVPRP